MRSILIAIVIIAQLLLGWLYFRDHNQCCAKDDDTSLTTPPTDAQIILGDRAQDVSDESISSKDKPVDGRGAESTFLGDDPADSFGTEASGPMLFNWNSANHILGDGWSTKRQSLIDGLQDNEQLEITGLYRKDETNNTTFENLGLARANGVKKLFSPTLADDRIVIRGNLTDAVNGDRSSPFESVSFRNVVAKSEVQMQVAPQVTEDGKERSNESVDTRGKATANTPKIVKETDDKTLIYFPYNSTNKLNDREVEAYLNDVVKRVKASGERVRLTGHTDSFGSAESNVTLGRYRADVVRSYLISKGVAANKITSQSKGETSPIASNKTKDGRAKNRRTELQIIK